MSHEEEEELETDLREQVSRLAHQVESFAGQAKSLKTAAPAVWLLLVLAFGFGGWQSLSQVRAQKADEKIEEHENSIDTLEMWRERTDSTKITASETQALIAALKETLAELDKRAVRSEDAFLNMQRQLDRIESRLGPGGAE